MKIVDLHVHSNRSDGTLSPAQLVDYAIEKNLSAFALTDHDTIDGLEEAINYANSIHFSNSANSLSNSSSAASELEVIPGIELSTEYQGKDIHIIGLYIDYHNPSFCRQLQNFVDSRIQRNLKMCTLLQQKGIDITYEKLCKEFPNSVITRAHYGKYLFHYGYVKSIQEAFERYIGDYAPCYVPREKVTPAQAVELILQADGIPILAHPILYHLSDMRLDALVSELTEVGLLGIEAIYATYHMAEEQQIRRLAKKYHLLISGGSDFHGSNKPGLDLATGYGNLVVPAFILDNIKASRKNLLFTDMDGTLLNDASEISPSLKAALDKITQKGHHLILSSGRPLPSILEVRENLGLIYPNMLIISNNGALIYDCDTKQNILVHRLELEDIRYIVNAAEKRHLHIHAYTDKEIVCHGLNDELKFYTRRIHMPLKCVKDIPSALTEGSYKLQAIHLTNRRELEDFRQEIADYCKDHIQLIFSNDQYLEILPAAAGKGSALSFVCRYLHAPFRHTFAAGDAENDISMLQAASTGIAMQNATEVVKQAAQIITSKDNNHDGLMEILEQYFL